MVRMFVRHPVKDFGTWKRVYDDFDQERRDMGVVGQSVFQAVDNPNDITAWHDFETSEAAHSFAESSRLHDTMASAGVAGAPTIWFTNPV